MSDQADREHNGGPSVAGEQLLGYVSRVERIEAEIDDLNADKREIYGEAKAIGFHKKVLRLIVRRRRMDPDQLREEEDLLELYERTLAETNARDPLE